MRRLSPLIYMPLFSAFKIINVNPLNIPVLIYHSVPVRKVPGAMSAETFKEQLEFFRENKFEVIPLAKLLGMMNKVESCQNNRNKICFTFDDGYADFFYNCWPLLKYYNFPATLFLVVDKIGRDGYLDEVEIRELSCAGTITLGSHGMGHRYLVGLGLDELKYEIKDSKEILEQRFGCPVDFFSYPWGGFSGRIQKVVREAGYRAAFTTNQRLRGSLSYDNYSLKRITMTEKDGLIRFLAKVSGFAYSFARRINPKELVLN